MEAGPCPCSCWRSARSCWRAPGWGPSTIVDSQLSDDLTSIATDLENGLRHYRAGNVDEALWWWQFSYVSSWGNLAGAVLNALLTVVAHDRLDAEFTGDEEAVAAANEMLETGATDPR